MVIEFIFAILIGLLAGTITGLFPGIHINLVSTLILSSLTLPLFTNIPIMAIVIFIVSMSITQTFIDFIPSIYLGAPEEDSFLTVLPGHSLLLKGQGHKAFLLTAYGSLLSLIIVAIFIPIFIFLLPSFQSLITPLLPFVLIFASLYLIFKEESFLTSLTIFILSGFLGFLTLNYLPIKNPLLPLLSGLFGLSALFVSLKNKLSLPKQSIDSKISLSKKQMFFSTLAASLTAPFSSFLPGFGSGQAAIVASEISSSDESSSPESFLFLVGMINTIVMALSFIAIFSIQKSRTGSAAAILKILETISVSQLLLITLAIFISGILAFFLGIKLSVFVSQNITKIPYKYLSISIIFILIAINSILSNPMGLLVLATATTLGIFCILSNSRRTNLMGSLLLPTILFYLL